MNKKPKQIEEIVKSRSEGCYFLFFTDQTYWRFDCNIYKVTEAEVVAAYLDETQKYTSEFFKSDIWKSIITPFRGDKKENEL